MNELMRSRGMRRAIAAACSAVLACAGLTLISVAPASATAPTVHDRVLSQNFSASGTFTLPRWRHQRDLYRGGEQGYSRVWGTGGNPAKITGALDNVGGGAQLGIRVASGVLSSAGGQPGGVTVATTMTLAGTATAEEEAEGTQASSVPLPALIRATR